MFNFPSQKSLKFKIISVNFMPFQVDTILTRYLFFDKCIYWMWTILKWNWSFSRHSFSIGHRIFLSGTCGKSRSRNVTLKIGVYIDDGIGFWVTLGYAFEHLIADHENLTKIETVATKRFFLESKTVFMSYPQPLWIIIMQIPWENLCCILLCFLLSCKFHT